MSIEECGGGKCVAYKTVELCKSTDFTRHKLQLGHNFERMMISKLIHIERVKFII